jgi:hypothetical protein
MTAYTPDELIAGFPHSSLPKVKGEPTFEDLKVIRRLLNNKHYKRCVIRRRRSPRTPGHNHD